MQTDCGADRLANHRRRILEVTELRARIRALRQARKLMMENTVRRNRKPWHETIAPGLYRVWWKAGGESLVAIGASPSGRRWIAPTDWNRGVLLESIVNDITQIAAVEDVNQPPAHKGFHITVDRIPLCGDFTKFTTQLRAKASEKFGYIPRCGYSSTEEQFAEASADLIRKFVPDAEVEVVTTPCPVECDNEQLRQERA